jgi:hypothetical protein
LVGEAAAHGRNYRAFGPSGFAGQVSHDVDLGLQRQAVSHPSLCQLDSRAVELGLADVLDGLVRRSGGVPLVPLTVPTYNGPPEPGPVAYQLADYPDALAAFRQGVSAVRRL